MSKLEIKVRNEQGQKVAYENDFLPVRKYREYLELQAEIDTQEVSEAEKLDKQLEFIAGLFPDLTVDAMYAGLEMSELNQIISDVFVKLVGGDTDPKLRN